MKRESMPMQITMLYILELSAEFFLGWPNLPTTPESFFCDGLCERRLCERRLSPSGMRDNATWTASPRTGRLAGLR